MKFKKTSLLNIPARVFWRNENIINSWRGIPVAGKECPQLAMRRALEFCAFCHRRIPIPLSPPVMNGALSERNRLSPDGSFRLIPSFKKSPFILCQRGNERRQSAGIHLSSFLRFTPDASRFTSSEDGFPIQNVGNDRMKGKKNLDSSFYGNDSFPLPLFKGWKVFI
jgi:hypothetical protein